MNGLPIQFETSPEASVSSGNNERQAVEQDSAGYGKLHSGYEKFPVMKTYATVVAIGPLNGTASVPPGCFDSTMVRI